MKTMTSSAETIVRRYLEGIQQIEDGNSIHIRSDQRGGLLRVPLESNSTVVIKFWRMRNLKERIKSTVHLSNGWREWSMHQYIHQEILQVPTPLEFFRITLSSGEHWEVMMIEDLGSTEQGLPYFKKLIKTGDESSIIEFEKGIIEITEQLVQLGVLDIDHQLNNFLVDRDLKIFRIDFECARKTRKWVLIQREYAEMIARLLASHVYAVQPDVQRTERFAELLYGKLKLDRKIRSMINERVKIKLKYQDYKMGITSLVTLPD